MVHTVDSLDATHCHEVPGALAKAFEYSSRTGNVALQIMRSKGWILAYMNRLTDEQRRYTEHMYQSHQREKGHVDV